MSKNTYIISAVLILIVGALFINGYVKNKDAKISPPLANSANTEVYSKKTKKGDGFLGDRGDKVESENGKILIPESLVEDGDLRSFNYFSSKKNKNVYFFIVRASDGTYRVAANACEVCYDSKKGFRQVGNLIKCDNCGVTYSKDTIALEKGGCNPGPIDKDAEIKDGQLIVNVQDIEAVASLF